MIDLSVVVSVYNEDQVLSIFNDELFRQLKLLNINFEVIFVDDGSTDNSFAILSELSELEKKIKVIKFSKNFGHESAMLAGIDNSKGGAIICMDCDLQHPPSLIGEMYDKYNQGIDILLMIREESENQRFLKKKVILLFYWFLNKISPIKLEPLASDFFMISRKIGDIIKIEFRERARFLRGIIQIIGFNKDAIKYTALSRVAGETKYSFIKLISLSINAVIALSKKPLKIGIYLGFLMGLFSVFMVIYSIIMKVLEHPLPGYTTLIVFISLMFSIQFFLIGIIGEYIGFLFEEQKKRPLYLIDHKINL